jgi:hypothetical protein
MPDMDDGLRLVALAARDAFARVETRLGRRQATPDKTVADAFVAAKAVLKVVERAQGSPSPRGMRCALGEFNGPSGNVYAHQIKSATAVFDFLKARGWREGLSDDRAMDLAVSILNDLRKEFPDIMNLPDVKRGVRCLPDYVQGPFNSDGVDYCYYRRGQYRVPLRGEIGSAEFMQAYRAAHRALSDPNRVERIAA